MLFLLLAGALAASGDVASSAPTRAVTLAVYTKKLAAVTDLKAEELAISEGGHERRILAVERDERRLDVAIVIDSSAGVAASYRSELVPGVIEFWKALPPGTAVAVWTTAPAKVADFGSDPAVVEPKLRTVAAAGGNYAIDSMTDACKELGTRGAPRRAVVYVGGASLLGNAQNTAELMRAVGVARAVPMSVLLLAGGNGAGGRRNVRQRGAFLRRPGLPRRDGEGLFRLLRGIALAPCGHAVAAPGGGGPQRPIPCGLRERAGARGRPEGLAQAQGREAAGRPHGDTRSPDRTEDRLRGVAGTWS